MIARKYTKEDKQMIDKWFLDRSYNAINTDLLPETGRIVDGIAAGFLYKTDSNLALIENFITNIESNKKERSEALDLIVSGLLQDAKDANMTNIIFLSNVPAIETRGKKFGFVGAGYYKLFTKDLTK